MNIQFSTTDKEQAWEYIKIAMPSVSRTAAEPLLELIGTQIRVGDPMMYGGMAPIFPMPGADINRARTLCLTMFSEPRSGGMDEGERERRAKP